MAGDKLCVVELWSRDAGRFWARGLISLVALLVVGGVCHVSIVPPQIHASDAFILMPLILCWSVSITAGRRIDVYTRACFGLCQGIILIFTCSNFWSLHTRFEETVFAAWAILTTIYTGMFAAVTHAIAISAKADVPGQCSKCGYLLRGLTVPRCPECGTPFDRERAATADGDALDRLNQE